MNRGMRHVIGGAALVAGILLQRGAGLCAASTVAAAVVSAALRAPQRTAQPRAAAAAAARRRRRSRARSRGQAAARAGRRRTPRSEAACLNKETPPGRADRGLHRRDRGGQRQAAPCWRSMYARRGDAYREKGDLDNAIKDFGEAIKLDAQERRRLSTAAACATAPRASSTTPSPTSSRRSSSIRRNADGLQQPQPRLLREARLRPRHPGSDAGDQAQSALHAGDLQSRHGLSRQGRARPRGAGLRSGAQDQRRTTRSPITTAAWPIATCATTTAPSATSIRRSRSTPTSPRRSTIAAWPMSPRARPTTPSRTSTRRS